MHYIITHLHQKSHMVQQVLAAAGGDAGTAPAVVGAFAGVGVDLAPLLEQARVAASAAAAAAAAGSPGPTAAAGPGVAPSAPLPTVRVVITVPPCEPEQVRLSLPAHAALGPARIAAWIDSEGKMA